MVGSPDNRLNSEAAVEGGASGAAKAWLVGMVGVLVDAGIEAGVADEEPPEKYLLKKPPEVGGMEARVGADVASAAGVSRTCGVICACDIDLSDEGPAAGEFGAEKNKSRLLDKNDPKELA